MIEFSSGYQVLSFIFFSLLCAWEHISMAHCEEQREGNKECAISEFLHEMLF